MIFLQEIVLKFLVLQIKLHANIEKNDLQNNNLWMVLYLMFQKLKISIFNTRNLLNQLTNGAETKFTLLFNTN